LNLHREVSIRPALNLHIRTHRSWLFKTKGDEEEHRCILDKSSTLHANIPMHHITPHKLLARCPLHQRDLLLKANNSNPGLLVLTCQNNSSNTSYCNERTQLTSRIRILEKLSFPELLKIFTALDKINYITIYTSAWQWVLSRGTLLSSSFQYNVIFYVS